MQALVVGLNERRSNLREQVRWDLWVLLRTAGLVEMAG